MAPTMSGTKKGIYIALGSNIGDRIGHVRKAVDELASRGVKTVRTSRLYESQPMYVEDQELFVNGVIEVCISFIRKQGTDVSLGRDGSGTDESAGSTEGCRTRCWAEKDI
jgi:hypothetical protein